MSDTPSLAYDSWLNGDPLQQIKAGTYEMYRDELAKKYSEEELAHFDALNKEEKKLRKEREAEVQRKLDEEKEQRLREKGKLDDDKEEKSS